MTGTCRLAALLAAVFLAPAGAAAADGGLAPEFIADLQQTQLDGARKALADIVANANLEDVALNRERYIAHSRIINHRIKSGGITNQKGSGRCWMFAGFNVLRPPLIKKFKLKEFEFSENYLLFWDKMEKSNLFLQLMIDLADRPLDDRYVEVVLDSPLGDGGWWTYFTDLVRKYGVVPKEVMPETVSSSGTGTMNRVLTMKLMEFGLDLRDAARGGSAADRLARRKEQMLTELYRMLVLTLGRPPTEFTWRYEVDDSTKIVTYPEPLTPQSFLTDIVAPDLDAYVALFNYPGKEYFTPYALELSRNMYDRPDFTILNVPIDTLKACALRSVLDSTAVWFACDVGRENYGADGILALDIYNYEQIYETTFDLPKGDLIHLGLITPNHAMAFVGVDTLGTHAAKWLVENSWGKDRGADGMWYMYDTWFDRYLFGAVIHERYLPEDLIALARQKPTVLPPWDPMYALNRLQ